MKDLDFMASADKRELSGFHPDKFINPQAWQDFSDALAKHRSEIRSYIWLGYSDGSSTIEEREFSSRKSQAAWNTKFNCCHNLNKIETSLLSFCDTIRTFSQLRDGFSQINESDLRQLAASLKDKGLLYFDDDYHMFLSIVSTMHKQPYEFKYDICMRNCTTTWNY